MYVKVTNGTIDQYPYTIGNLRRDNPNTSFPKTVPNEVLADFGVFPVKRVNKPDINPLTQDVKESSPKFENGRWVQSWLILEVTPEEADKRHREKNLQIEENRQKDYKSYSDPIFFKWQRGEVEKQEWLDAVNHVKELNPYA